jgi:hypothetical protein
VDLIHKAVGDRFVEFEDSARWLPVAVVGAADDQEAALVVEAGGGDADGVSGGLVVVGGDGYDPRLDECRSCAW